MAVVVGAVDQFILAAGLAVAGTSSAVLFAVPRRHTGASKHRPDAALAIYLEGYSQRDSSPLFPQCKCFREHTGTGAVCGNGQFSHLSLLNAIAAVHGTPRHGPSGKTSKSVQTLLIGHHTRYGFDA